MCLSRVTLSLYFHEHFFLFLSVLWFIIKHTVQQMLVVIAIQIFNYANISLRPQILFFYADLKFELRFFKINNQGSKYTYMCVILLIIVHVLIFQMQTKWDIESLDIYLLCILYRF